MTPLQYHSIGALVVAILFLSGRFGPHDFRGWPSGMVNDGWRVKAAVLVFLFLAWPLAAAMLALMYAFWLLSFLRYFPLEIVGKTIAVIGYIAMVGGVGYWLVMIAIPFLAHWYGITA